VGGAAGRSRAPDGDSGQTLTGRSPQSIWPDFHAQEQQIYIRSGSVSSAGQRNQSVFDVVYPRVKKKLVLNNLPRLRANSPIASQPFMLPMSPRLWDALRGPVCAPCSRLERKENERSHRRFVLMILESGELLRARQPRRDGSTGFCVLVAGNSRSPTS